MRDDSLLLLLQEREKQETNDTSTRNSGLQIAWYMNYLLTSYVTSMISIRLNALANIRSRLLGKALDVACDILINARGAAGTHVVTVTCPCVNNNRLGVVLANSITASISHACLGPYGKGFALIASNV
jgi:hypothetical protein